MNRKMDPKNGLSERLLELLAGRAAGQLEPDEQRQLETLLRDSLNSDASVNSEVIAEEALRLELTAAAIEVSGFEKLRAEKKQSQHGSNVSSEAIPVALRDRLLVDAVRHFHADPVLENEPEPAGGAHKVSTAPRNRDSSDSGFGYREMFAWLATAVAVMLMVNGWNPFSAGDNEAEPSLAVQLAEFVEQTPVRDLVDVQWTANLDADASGRIVWSDVRQKGFMEFRNLDVNDPAVEQYQLWIFETPEDEHPVDGGVFDICAENVGDDGTSIVSVVPAIPLQTAALFAVTIEKPGGVVVSDRERIPVLAKVE